MAPDKIFIDEDLIAFHILQTKHEGDVEYIRKDALLEWLNKQFVETVDKRDFHRNCAFSEVIEKLNSM